MLHFICGLLGILFIPACSANILIPSYFYQDNNRSQSKTISNLKRLLW